MVASVRSFLKYFGRKQHNPSDNLLVLGGVVGGVRGVLFGRGSWEC